MILDIRPCIKWTVSLVIGDDHLIFSRGLCGYILINILNCIIPEDPPDCSRHVSYQNSLDTVAFVFSSFWFSQQLCDAYVMTKLGK